MDLTVHLNFFSQHICGKGRCASVMDAQGVRSRLVVVSSLLLCELSLRTGGRAASLLTPSPTLSGVGKSPTAPGVRRSSLLRVWLSFLIWSLRVQTQVLMLA